MAILDRLRKCARHPGEVCQSGIYEQIMKSCQNQGQILRKSYFGFLCGKSIYRGDKKIFTSKFFVGAFQIFSYSHRHIGAYRKNRLQIRRKFLRFIFQKFRVYFVWVAGTFKFSIKISTDYSVLFLMSFNASSIVISLLTTLKYSLPYVVPFSFAISDKFIFLPL